MTIDNINIDGNAKKGKRAHRKGRRIIIGNEVDGRVVAIGNNVTGKQIKSKQSQ